MAKIVLVRPPQLLREGALTPSQGTPHIGVAYLSASLKYASHDVSIIDALGESLNQFTKIKGTNLLINGLTAVEIADLIPEEVEIIGITCMFSSEWFYTKEVINEIHKAFPNKPIIAGGEHITADPEYSLRTGKGLTACALGEGEETIIDLVDVILRKQSLHDIKGIAFIDDSGKFVKTARRTRIGSLDEIPWPDWDNYPIESYLQNGYGYNVTRGRPMPMVLSRGCPFQCTFCSSPNMWTTKWVARDIDDAVKEIKFNIEKYNVDHIELYDLTSIIKKKYILDFAKVLIKENINISWSLPSGTRSEALDKEVLTMLKKAGCNKLTYAPESGSPATLKRIKKKVRLDRMLKSIRLANKIGIRVKSNIMLGFPGETKYDILQTFGFLAKTAWIGMQDAAIYRFVPYPGSELFLQLVDEKRIGIDVPAYEDFLLGNVYGSYVNIKSWSEHISEKELSIFMTAAIFWFYSLSFLFRPQRFITFVYRTIRNTPITTLDLVMDNIVGQNRKKRREAFKKDLVEVEINKL